MGKVCRPEKGLRLTWGPVFKQAGGITFLSGPAVPKKQGKKRVKRSIQRGSDGDL